MIKLGDKVKVVNNLQGPIPKIDILLGEQCIVEKCYENDNIYIVRSIKYNNIVWSFSDKELEIVED